MYIKTYGIFDTAAKTLRSTFTSENDETAIRSCEIVAKDPNADRDTLKDCVVKYLYTVESADGSIVDIQQRDLVAFASLLEKVGPVNVDKKSMAELKDMFLKLKQSYASMGESMNQQSTVNEAMSKEIQSLKKIVNDIIGGNIKCQKYRKRRAK